MFVILLCFVFNNFIVSGHRFYMPSPLPRYPEILQAPIIATDLNSIAKEEIYGLPWERSGLFQGDIVVAEPGETKNTLLASSKKWTMPVPVYINGSDFNKKDMGLIEKALTEIEEKTCVRFRQYRINDPSFVVVRGHSTGCWSMVGRQDGGQVVHLQRPSCMHHGIVIHEFLHALGLHHQQCSPDRDEYVKIHWQNIRSGAEHNFVKYSDKTVTTYNLTYDFGSLMHYSDKAFSKNGESTITPLDHSATIGQRARLSVLDATKVRYLYECPEQPVIKEDSSSNEDDYNFDISLEDLEDILL